MRAAAATEDASYHSRHRRRSTLRAERIAAHLDGPVTVLDVGCNQGVTSSYLLQTGAASAVTGIELSASTVSNTLRSDSRFNLIEGDIAQVTVPGMHDVCIYGAVHHHVFAQHGLGVAVAVLQKLAASSRRMLFFETGHLSEGGRWGWQRTIRRYFRTDEEHLYYLMSCIEHLLDDFHVIGQFRIHGIRRWLIRADLSPGKKRPPVPCDSEGLPELTTGVTYGRRFGSRVPPQNDIISKQLDDSPVWFNTAQGPDGQRYFLKRHIHRPLAGANECVISRQVPYAWAVHCLGQQRDTDALVFPYVSDSMPIQRVFERTKPDRMAVAGLLVDIFREAGRTAVSIENKALLPISRPVSILHLCDLNPNNILATVRGSCWSLWVVDFEQQGRMCIWRNRMHLGRLLLGFRRYPLRGIFLYLAGLLGVAGLMLVYQFRSPALRIRHRQPNLLSVVVTEYRSLSGRALAHALRLIGRQ